MMNNGNTIVGFEFNVKQNMKTLLLLCYIILAILGFVVCKFLFSTYSEFSGVNYYVSYIAYFAIGILLSLLFIYYLEEQTIIKISIPGYVISIVMLLMSLVLFFLVKPYGQSTPFYFYNSKQLFFFVSGVPIGFSPVMLFPLYGLLVAYYCNKDHKIGGKNLGILTLLMIIPIIFCLFLYPGAAIVLFFSFAFTVIALKRVKKITVSWKRLVLAIIVGCLLLIIFLLFVSDSRMFYRERLQSILAFGENDPLGVGWYREAIGRVIEKSRFVGSCVSSTYRGIYSLYNAGGFTLVIILARFGWLALICCLLIMGMMLVLTIVIVRDIKYDSFSKYVAVFSVSFLCCQTVLNIVGVALLDTGFMDLPFVSPNKNLAITDMIFLALVIRAHRNDRENNH